MRNCILFLYKLSKTVAEAKKKFNGVDGGDSIGSSAWMAYKNCKLRFKNKPGGGSPQEFENDHLEF